MKRALIILSLGLFIAVSGISPIALPGFYLAPAWADGDRESDHDSDRGSGSRDSDHDSDNRSARSGSGRDQAKLGAVRDDVSKSKILSLSTLKAVITKRFGPNIIDIEIEKKKGLWIYEFKVISKTGRLVEVYMNAETGHILKIENE